MALRGIRAGVEVRGDTVKASRSISDTIAVGRAQAKRPPVSLPLALPDRVPMTLAWAVMRMPEQDAVEQALQERSGNHQDRQ